MSSEAIAVREERTVSVGARGVEIRTFEDLWRMAKVAHASGLMPRGINSPEAACMIIQAGLELALSPWQALQGMQSINGKVGIGGDLALAIVRASGLMESYHAGVEGEGDEMRAVVTSRRKGEAREYVSTFSVADAKRAQLWGKAGPWSQYATRMLTYRALGFHLRDFYPEPLKGFKTSEELSDYPTRGTDPTPIRAVDEPAPRNRKGVTPEQRELIERLLGETGIDGDSNAMSRYGMPVDELPAGAAQAFIGWLKIQPKHEPEPEPDAVDADEVPPPAEALELFNAAVDREAEPETLPHPALRAALDEFNAIGDAPEPPPVPATREEAVEQLKAAVKETGWSLQDFLETRKVDPKKTKTLSIGRIIELTNEARSLAGLPF